MPLASDSYLQHIYKLLLKYSGTVVMMVDIEPVVITLSNMLCMTMVQLTHLHLVFQLKCGIKF